MKAIKAARKLIETDPTTPAARILADLVLALENETAFSISDLYQLNSEHFSIAIDVLDDWRIDRYYLGKTKLFATSWHHRMLRDTDLGADGQAAEGN